MCTLTWPSCQGSTLLPGPGPLGTFSLSFLSRLLLVGCTGCYGHQRAVNAHFEGKSVVNFVSCFSSLHFCW